MGAVLEKRKRRIQYINGDVPLLKSVQPEVSQMEDIAYWRTLAKNLDSSVLGNDITMQEIVDEVNAVRRERYEKQNGI